MERQAADFFAALAAELAVEGVPAIEIRRVGEVRVSEALARTRSGDRVERGQAAFLAAWAGGDNPAR